MFTVRKASLKLHQSPLTLILYYEYVKSFWHLVPASVTVEIPKTGFKQLKHLEDANNSDVHYQGKMYKK